MKQPIRILSVVLVLTFFTLCLLSCTGNTEHTELVVDGEYQPFNVPRKTMEKLMELVEVEDVDYIYKVFSQVVRESTDDLYERIQELICFLGSNGVSWEFVTGIGDTQRNDGMTSSTRSSIYDLHMNSGTYSCIIDDVLKDSSHKETVGFSSIKIYPLELFTEYASIEPFGIYIVYRAEDVLENVSIEPSSMETLMLLAEKENTDSIYEAFSLTAKRTSEGLQERTSELMDFLSEQVISLEPYSWTQNIETIDGTKATTREMFFYLYTDNGLYRCDIREVLEHTDQENDAGFSSISIFPALYPGEKPPYEDNVYKEYCTWGRDNMGISIVYQ